MPDVASVPANPTVNAWLYQPFESGARLGVAVTTGPVESYWKLNALFALVFPARSRHVPLRVPVASSGPEYVVCVQVSIPDVASVPANATVNAWLYQPFESGARDGVDPVTCGAVES
jgi:hypothetical protein